MEITLTEALRLKNELSNAIKTLNYGINKASLGDTFEDKKVISPEDTEKFSDVEDRLINALNYSEELNNTISSFNKDNGVDGLVRKMQNSKLLMDVYTRSLPRTKPNKQTKFENLGTVRQSIEISYVPYVSSKDMKEKISKQKLLTRELQAKIEKLNQSKITLTFDYSDLEKLIS